jgi:2-polyprenyl-3-methyl-5-hydroxy-6-metoxy-1,4-benzoquinol methylase
VDTYNQAQFDDLKVRDRDLYANTKYDILEHYLAGKRGLRILNVGCGSGELSCRLGDRGHTVLGIDPESSYIELALGNAAATKHTNCSFQVCSIEDFSGPGDFDCVITTDVLEHIKDDRAAFAKMVSLVKPGGLVLITVPAGQWLFGYHDEQLGHFRRYSMKTLRTLVSPLCDIRAIRYFGFSLIPVCLVFSRWLRRSYPVAESGDQRKRPLAALLFRALMKIDRMLPLPVGTSLLLQAVRKQAQGAMPALRLAA